MSSSRGGGIVCEENFLANSSNGKLLLFVGKLLLFVGFYCL